MLSKELTKKEKQIMEIFWKSDKPISAAEINELDKSLNKNTIQAVLRKLLSYNLIEVKDIGYSGTVLTRLYVANISQEKFIAESLSDKSFKKLISNFIENSKDSEELEELENLIQKKKNQLKR